MSWTASILVVEKSKALHSLYNELTISPQDIDGPMLDQLSVAQDAAKVLLKNISGPKISISMHGHANGVGWSKKSGYTDDTITVSVSQVVD